jgi:hypothetical protein
MPGFSAAPLAPDGFDTVDFVSPPVSAFLLVQAENAARNSRAIEKTRTRYDSFRVAMEESPNRNCEMQIDALERVAEREERSRRFGAFDFT